MKALRFIGAWVFYALGYTVNRIGLDRFNWGGEIYQWAMAKSVVCQGFYGFNRWPWSEPELWEAPSIMEREYE